MKKTLLACMIACISSGAYADRNYHGVSGSYESTGASEITSVVGFFDIDDLFAVGITMNETSYDAVSSDVFYTQNIQGLMVPHVSITDNFSGYGVLGGGVTNMIEDGSKLLSSMVFTTAVGVKHDFSEYITGNVEYEWIQADKFCTTNACIAAMPQEDLASSLVRARVAFGDVFRTTVGLVVNVRELDNFGSDNIGLSLGMGYTFE